MHTRLVVSIKSIMEPKIYWCEPNANVYWINEDGDLCYTPMFGLTADLNAGGLADEGWDEMAISEKQVRAKLA